MERPAPVLVIALVSTIGGLVLLANTFTGNNNWLINSISNPSVDSQGLLPIANALKKDLMLDVSPQLHPSTVVGESAKGIKFQHWIDNDRHCEDCLRLEIPNNGKKAGAAFSSDGAVYNFEGAKKIRFYAMGEEPGAKVDFKAVGNDKGKTTAGGINNSSKNNKNVSSNDLFKDQEFALTSQNVTLNQTWSYFEMGLEGAQQKLSKVKYPFALELVQGKGKTTILYLKGISYSDEPIQAKYLLEPSSGNTTASISAMTTATTALNVTLKDNATETVTAPATVEFNANVTSGKEPYSFDWNFRDGALEKDTDGNIIHTFEEAGSYDVRVNVTDSLNNTGSAHTMVDVAENVTQNSEAVANNNTQNTNETTTVPAGEDNQTEQSGDNSTSSNSTTEADEQEPPNVLEDTNSTDSSASEPEVNNNTTETVTNEPNNPDTSNNSPPVGNAGNDVVGKPKEMVILDASKSTDPDPGDRIESYQWQQESGPTAKINDKSSPTPIVTLPNVDNDATLVFSLTVNDGTVDSEKKDTISVFVDYVEKLTNNVQQKVLKPADIKVSEWIPSNDCKQQDDAQCLSDGSAATFVAADGTETIDPVNLYSFGEFSEQAAGVDPNGLAIERVVAEITAKKTGNTGYVSFAIDDPGEAEHYFTPSLSIASSSFQKYNYVWDVNPVSGEKWTYDSLNSLIAGFKNDGGQSGVQISELQLTVSYYLPEPSPASDSGTAQDTSNNEANDAEGNDENSTSGPENTDQDQGDEQQQEEPAPETDSTNSTSADAGGDDSSTQSEE
jgi:hypothetical protein